MFFTPKDEKKLLQQVLDNETVCLPQFGDDLGERMKNAIGIVLRMGYEKVILIGTDIPQIHPETLKNAFDNLGGKDIVIHPTFDGGYYLIGMKKEYDSIWKIERYGTNTVIYDTLQHMRNEKLSTAVGCIMMWMIREICTTCMRILKREQFVTVQLRLIIWNWD